MRAVFIAAALVLAGCQLDEPTLGGTVLSAVQAEGFEPAESPKYYEHPLAPEAWDVEVQLDDGSTVVVTHNGSRRYAPGERVRLLVDPRGELLL